MRADPARANASEHVAEDANQKHRKQSIKTICDTRKAKLKEKTGCARSKERAPRKFKDMCYICQLQTIFTSEKRTRSCTDPSTSSGAALTESSAGTTPFLQRFRGWRDDAWPRCRMPHRLSPIDIKRADKASQAPRLRWCKPHCRDSQQRQSSGNASRAVWQRCHMPHRLKTSQIS